MHRRAPGTTNKSVSIELAGPRLHFGLPVPLAGQAWAGFFPKAIICIIIIGSLFSYQCSCCSLQHYAYGVFNDDGGVGSVSSQASGGQ